MLFILLGKQDQGEGSGTGNACPHPGTDWASENDTIPLFSAGDCHHRLPQNHCRKIYAAAQAHHYAKLLLELLGSDTSISARVFNPRFVTLVAAEVRREFEISAKNSLLKTTCSLICPVTSGRCSIGMGRPCTGKPLILQEFVHLPCGLKSSIS
jgi:hypothetical protein